MAPPTLIKWQRERKTGKWILDVLLELYIDLRFQDLKQDMRALNELKQVSRFILSAGLATAVNVAVAETLVLSRIVSSPFAANAIAFLPAVVVSYWAQRRFTFRSQGSGVRFLALAMGGFAVNNLALFGVTAQGAPPVAGLLVSVLASPALTYIGCRQLVFAQKKRLAEASL